MCTCSGVASGRGAGAPGFSWRWESGVPGYFGKRADWGTLLELWPRKSLLLYRLKERNPDPAPSPKSMTLSPHFLFSGRSAGPWGLTCVCESAGARGACVHRAASASSPSRKQ